MSKTKQGKFSNYQFSKTILQNTSGGWKTERSSTEKGSNIHEFSQLDSFREKTAKIYPDCAVKLQSARQRTEQTQRNYLNRIRGGNYFLNYKQNPFLPTENKDNLNLSQQQINIKDGLNSNQIKISHFNQKKQNIIEAVNQLNSKVQNNRLDRRLTQKKIQKNKKYAFLLERDQAKKNIAPKKKRENRMMDRVNKSFKQQSLAEDPLVFLDRILRMEDHNFFERKLKNTEINIFNILHLKKGEGFTKKKIDILAMNKFCFESIVKATNESSSVDIEKHIAPIYQKDKAKSSEKEQDQEIYEEKIDLDIENVDLKNMIRLANGNLTPDQLATYLRDMKQMSREQKNDDETWQVDNKENQREVSVLNQGIKQIDYVNNEVYSKRQRWQHQFNENCKKKLKEVLDTENECVNKRIYDDKLRRKLKKEKDKIMKYQVAYTQVTRGTKIKNSQINMAVNGKDRVQNIKVKGLVQTLNINKIYETVWMSRSKNKKNSIRFF